MSSASFYKWWARYGGMDAPFDGQYEGTGRVKSPLKKMFTEERLKAEIVQEALQKSVKPSGRKEIAQQAVTTKGISIRQACHALGISETCYRYQPRLHSENEENANWL